jgi:glycosyltransferase involved in cell wall biosynthesis
MKIDQPISVIIPAYNEAKNIGHILEVLKEIKWIDEIIVVDDCSADKTLRVVEKMNLPNLTVTKNGKNLGKGGALVTGIKKAKYDLLLFLDADLIGLKEEHLLQILAPVIFTQEADLVLGVFTIKHMRKHAATKIFNRAWPSITGQRAIWKKDLPPLNKMENSRYGVDYLMTKHVPKNRRLVVKLEGLSQKIKEEKGDLAEAIRLRIKMYQQILKEIQNNKKGPLIN